MLGWEISLVPLKVGVDECPAVDGDGCSVRIVSST